MKDLFGNDVPDNPPMDAPLPWLLWRVDFPNHPTHAPEYWLAQTREQAEAAFADTMGGWKVPVRFQVYEVTAAPTPQGEDDPLTDAGAAWAWADTQWRPDAPCHFCGGDE